jgi:hypothetical protein
MSRALSLTLFWGEIRSKKEEKEKNKESFEAHTTVAPSSWGEKRDREKRRSFYQADKKSEARRTISMKAFTPLCRSWCEQVKAFFTGLHGHQSKTLAMFVLGAIRARSVS